MKVIVTGNLGFIGHHVTEALVQRGHQVIGIDRIDGAVSFKGDRIVIQRPWPVKQETVDLSNVEAVLAVVGKHKPQAIAHMAAQYSVKYTTEACVRYVQNNLAAFTYIMEAAKVVGVPRFVYASSVAVSDEGKPSGLYGATKAYGEECAHAYSVRSHMTAIGLRFGPTYGPLSRRDSPSFVALNEYMANTRLSPCALFSRSMPYVFVKDAARVAADFATTTKPMDSHNVFLVAADEQLASIVDIVRCARSMVGREPQWPRGVTVSARSDKTPDVSSLREVLGYAPTTKLSDGIGDMLRWMRASA